MEEYYKILGLEPGAKEAEIKRAYFKLVRQFPPEKDPEQFQKIRKAYEQLIKQGGKQQGPVFEALENPLAISMLRQITECRESGDDIKFRDTCQEAWKYFPDKIQFLYLLVIAQRQCGNTGKAVNNGELLVKKEPKNPWFWKELALSYLERGYTQKAFPACEKAYELGNREPDFILLYAEECMEYGEPGTGIRILQEMVANPKDWKKEDMPEYMEAYAMMFYMDGEQETSTFVEMGDSLLNVLKVQGKHMEDYLPLFALALDGMSTNPMWGDKEFDKAEEILLRMEECTGNQETKDVVNMAYRGVLIEKLEADTRFDKIIRIGVEAFCKMNDEEEFDEALIKYAITDVKLCMIMERESILRQAEILKEDYQVFYDMIKPFFDQLKGDEKSLSLLKDRLLKDYQRMILRFEEGYFMEKYPKELERINGSTFYEGDVPYIRPGKKIGRNDPCPCGSGKKYKQCCMGK